MDRLLHGLIRRALGLPGGFLTGEATQGELRGELRVNDMKERGLTRTMATMA